LLGGQALSSWSREHRPWLPVLFISGYTENAVARDTSMTMGAHFLQKPFSPSDLCRKVREMLDGRGDGPNGA
jgi:FixJ family two-component response regulator